jgi:hypothetical protein
MSEFVFFGDTFHLRPSDECNVAMLDFAELATGGVDENSIEGLAVVKGFLRDVVVEADWAAFWRSARKNHATVRGDLMPIIVQVITGEAARPTSRPSDSSDGPASTPESSALASSSPDIPPPVPALPVKLRAVQRLEDEGRPDKALMVQMAVDARASEASA